MESEIFGISMPMLSPTAVAMEISSSSVDHGVIVPTDTLTGQSQTYYLMGGYPFFSTLQEEAIDSSCAFGNPIPPDHLQESPLLLSSPASSLQALLPYGCCGRLNSSLSASNACAFDAEDDGHSLRWSLEMLQARSMATTGCPSGSDSAWVSGKSSLVSDDPYAYGVPGNELSLTLGSRQQSEMSCSGITSKEKGSRGGGATELPVSSQFLLGGGAPGFVQLSPAVLASPYLHAAHQVLAEVTGCAIEEESKPDDPQYLCSEEFRAHEPKTLKTELIGMLQMIDHGYSECVDRIQNVIASFMSTTSPPPAQTPARFVLRAVSALYKSLRERIVSQMHSLGQQFSGEFMFEPEESLEYSFLHRRWALQQLKNDHQSWRPQRGLPEKSVAVLRSWMFQNFLHPYPKDNEKQLLALKSGLTRSQVSNWFINARVRLWKPMIEEMYQEMSRKARRDEGAGDNQGDGASPGVRSS